MYSRNPSCSNRPLQGIGFAEITVLLDLHDESAIAELLRAVQARHPDVYVKSRARSFADGDEIRVTLTAAGPNNDAARRTVEATFADLGNGLEGMGVRILG